MKASSNPFIKHPILQIIQTKCKTLAKIAQTHAQMITTGLILHTYPLSQILSAILSSTAASSLPYALTIFNHVPNPTTFLFNSFISSTLTHHNQHTHLAFSLYNQILCLRTIKPNSHTYPSLFKACGSQPLWFKHGQALHTHVLKFLEPNEYDQFVQASLINFYSKCGKLGVCRYLFDQIGQPDLALWNSMLSAYNNSTVNDSDLSMEVLCLFADMQKKSKIRPNEVSFVAFINSCADLGALSEGLWAHSYVVKNNLKLNRYLVTSLINFYINCGFLEFARHLFDEFPKKDIFCYNAMIRGFATHGCAREALDLFKEMTLEGLAPDDVTMVVIICACSHVGLVEEGCKFFDSMREKYGLEPKLEHYGCLVDLLGRAGRLHEAKERICTMPMKPNAVLWRSLLGASRNHEDLATGEVALEHLIELEPETSGNYILLSNMYAIMNKWEGVNRVRKLMQNHRVGKVSGTSVLGE